MSKPGTARLACGLFLLRSAPPTRTRLGGEFQVNSYTPTSRSTPRWRATPMATSSSPGWTAHPDVLGQWFALRRVRRCKRAAFLVNSYTPGIQGRPAVARDDSGDFVIVWPSPDGGSYGVFGRRFDASGTPLAQEFLVNTLHARSSRTRESISMQTATSSWCGTATTRTATAVRACSDQRFGSNGGRVGAEFQVNTATWLTGSQQPDLGLDADGDLVVVWGGPDESDYGVSRDVSPRRASAEPCPGSTPSR